MFNGEHKLHILPKELEVNLDLRISSKTCIEYIVFPNCISHDRYKGSINYLNDDYKLLKENCYTPKDPDFHEDWLNIREVCANTLEERADNIIRYLLKKKDKYKFYYSFDSYTQTLQDLVNKINMQEV